MNQRTPDECLRECLEPLGAKLGAIYWRTLTTKPFSAAVFEGFKEQPELSPDRLAQLEQVGEDPLVLEFGEGFYVGLLRREKDFEMVVEVYPGSKPEPDLLEAFQSSANSSFLWLRSEALSAALSRQRHLTRAVLKEVVDGIFTLDKNGRIVVFNRAAELITGYRVNEIRGRDPNLMLKTSEPIIDLSSLGEWREIRICTKEGRERIIRIHFRSPAEDEPFPDFAWVGVFRDISRQKELEELRLDFTTTLSHELRTPLAGVKGYLHTLMHRKAREYPVEKVQSTLAIINHQVDRLAKLIDDLLEAARLGSQALEVNPRTVDLTPVLVATLKGYRDSEPDYQLRLSCPETLVCRCDAEQLVYVLSHLLSNAVKYSVPGGLIEMVAGLMEGELRISVRDQGVGIPMDQQEHIFEMYHRVCNEDSRTHYGMGIGLYLARKVIDAHGGRLQVQSAPGCGSTFTIAVPQRPRST